jgi:hypothetical protein
MSSPSPPHHHNRPLPFALLFIRHKFLEPGCWVLPEFTPYSLPPADANLKFVLGGGGVPRTELVSSVHVSVDGSKSKRSNSAPVGKG